MSACPIWHAELSLLFAQLSAPQPQEFSVCGTGSIFTVDEITHVSLLNTPCRSLSCSCGCDNGSIVPYSPKAEITKWLLLNFTLV